MAICYVYTAVERKILFLFRVKTKKKLSGLIPFEEAKQIKSQFKDAQICVHALAV
ncbi:hypothetical protein SAMN04487906_0762 [Zhouia amylolytica]|uniref:Uncharacterized protein n=2 Tax=Zhouia amylolytica TaxID=376730 RepID=W2UNY6_9FLAO|nr:hypothetical protein [Zhouia amylolytica]ETN95870.1 hypothetical protein P278_15920 [Zhouia amylolytica AD3]SFS54187.1 hypothetical protein SAMN04487906_0762 [Zhouia amylolytica]